MIQGQDQIIDIYDVWYQPWYYTSWAYYFVISFIMFVLIGIAWYWYRKYQLRINPIDGSLVAKKKLENLKKIRIETEQDSKDCYFELSSIIKQYLSYKFDPIFIKLTDKELVHQATVYLDDENIRVLKKVFQDMIFIKFERQVAMHETLQNDIERIERLIDSISHLDETKEC